MKFKCSLFFIVTNYMLHHNHAPPPPYRHSGPSDSNGPPPPPDLNVYEEGPPPANHPLNLPIPPPPDAPSHGGGPEEEIENTAVDGGDETIWGILDLAEMLEKGIVPGQNPTEGNKEQHSSSPQRATATGGSTAVGTGSAGTATPTTNTQGRVVVPIFTRAPPPRSHSEEQQAEPPIPPSSYPQDDSQFGPGQNPKYPYPSSSDGGFDYDEQSGGVPGAGPNAPPYGAGDSREGSDYGDGAYN